MKHAKGLGKDPRSSSTSPGLEASRHSCLDARTDRLHLELLDSLNVVVMHADWTDQKRLRRTKETTMPSWK